MANRFNPTAVYHCQKSETAKGKYFLREKIGKSTLQFGVGKRKPDIGKEYVLLDLTQHQKAGGRQFETALYSTHPVHVGEKHKHDGNKKAVKARISGLNFRAEDMGKSYGDTLCPYIQGNEALLVERSEDLQTLTLAVFRDMAAQAQSLFQSWKAGELSLVPGGADLPEGGGAA
jgi:hypothetical protein